MPCAHSSLRLKPAPDGGWVLVCEVCDDTIRSYMPGPEFAPDRSRVDWCGVHQQRASSCGRCHSAQRLEDEVIA